MTGERRFRRFCFLGVLLLLPDLSVLGAEDFMRGDTNRNGRLEIADSIRVLTWVFMAGPEPSCLDAADANDSSEVDLSDIVYLNNYLYMGGPPPLSPFPACGRDPTSDSLSCITSACP